MKSARSAILAFGCVGLILSATLPLPASAASEDAASSAGPAADAAVDSGAPTLPPPPKGFRWQPLSICSDEFNSPTLDATRWMPRHPSWSGRNSRFETTNVSVSNGMLRLRSSLREAATEVSRGTVTAACVTSKNRLGPAFYEARVKASRLSMTSSFWFQGRYSEIDVIENLGRPSRAERRWVEDTMMMNTHYFPQGWRRDIATPMKWSMPDGAAQRFHVYGVWWKDEQTIWFYHDGVKVAETVSGGPFREKQRMFFDTEVFTEYGWPTAESLRNPAENTMLVDWVRGWELVPDSDEQNP